MITRIKVRNFKSLGDFEITDLAPFTCLIGLNGSGKTTLLQFLDFVHALLQGRIKEWFEQYKWDVSDIITFGSAKRIVEFEIDVTDSGNTQTWFARFNIQEMRCTQESLVMKRQDNTTEDIAFYTENKLKLYGNDYPLPPNFKQQGSIFSILHPLPATPAAILASKTFGVLDPSSIAQSTQTKAGHKNVEVKSDGYGLVGFISQLPELQQRQLFVQLHEFYPAVKNHKIRKQHFGWKNLLLNEIENAYFDASHLSYGTLRLLVILSQYYSENGCLIFDEIENGINQELVEKLLALLQDFNGKQVLVTTHSALVLNYLSDDAARDSVVLLFKDADGHTHAMKFFEHPDIAPKMEFMAPGQIMSQTNLIELSRKLALPGEEK